MHLGFTVAALFVLIGAMVFLVCSWRTIRSVDRSQVFARSKRVVFFNRAFTAVIILSAFFGFWDAQEAHQQHPIRSFVGATLFLISSIIYCKSTNALRHTFSPISELRPEHNLVTTGIYRFSRNPVYVSYCGAVGGVGLFTGSVLFWVLGLIQICRILWRIPEEESAMEARFGVIYKSYKTSTPRFFWPLG